MRRRALFSFPPRLANGEDCVWGHGRSGHTAVTAQSLGEVSDAGEGFLSSFSFPFLCVLFSFCLRSGHLHVESRVNHTTAPHDGLLLSFRLGGYFASASRCLDSPPLCPRPGYLQPRDLPSRGVFPFVRGLLCNTGATCRNRSYAESTEYHSR